MSRKSGTILSFITLFLEIFTAMLFTPFLIRSFGQAEYGVYTLIIAITSYLALLDLGVGHSVVRFMAKYRANNEKEEQNKLLGTMLIYYMIIALIAAILGIVMVILFPMIYAKGLTPTEIKLAQTLLIMTVLNVVVTLATSCFASTIIAYENFLISKGLNIVIVLLRVGIGVALLLLGLKSIAIVALHTILSIILRLFMTGFVLFKLKIIPKFKGMRFLNAKEIVSYSGFILLQMIATQINSMADQILIGALVPAASIILGIYAVGIQVVHYFQAFGSAINGTLMPGVVRMVEKDDRIETVQAEMTRIGRMNFMLVGIIWCVFAVFGRQFVALWAGQENIEAYGIALLLMLPYVFILTQNIGTQVLWAKNKHKMQSILKFVIVILNVVLTIFLIQWHPLYGPVIGTFLSLMLGDVTVMQIVFKRDIGLSLGKYYKDLFTGILPALLITMAVGFAFRLLNLGGWIGFIVNCFVMVGVYALCMFGFGINASEKKMLGKMLHIGRKRQKEQK